MKRLALAVAVVASCAGGGNPKHIARMSGENELTGKEIRSIAEHLKQTGQARGSGPV